MPFNPDRFSFSPVSLRPDAQPTPMGEAPQAPAAPGVQGFDMYKLLSLLLGSAERMQGADQHLRSDMAFGRHLGMGGGEITPDNPTGNAANPWAENGLFHGGFGKQQTGNSWELPGGGTRYVVPQEHAMTPPPRYTPGLIGQDQIEPLIGTQTPDGRLVAGKPLRKGSSFGFGAPNPPTGGLFR